MKGFTLIELMITVAIIAILAAVSYPSYKEYLRKGRRVDAKVALLDASQAMERRYTETLSFAGTGLIGTGTGTIIPSTSLNGDYTISFASQSATAYQLQAAPSSTRQTGDNCGTFLLDNTGVKSLSSNTYSVADCW